MAWMRFVGWVFNFLGVLFAAGAIVAVIIGVVLGAPTEASTPESTRLFGILFGMMGTVGALIGFISAMIMFFFGAVVLGVRRMTLETIATRQMVERMRDDSPGRRLAPGETLTAGETIVPGASLTAPSSSARASRS